MKKKALGISLIISGFALTLGAFLIPSNKADTVGASSYSVNTVPTRIDCNDSTDSEILSYYSNLSNLSASERSGTNLLKNLKPILKNGQKYFSYGSGATTAVWQAYEIVDRDWEKSPASAISSYNSTTKIISNYTYGTSNSNVGTNPYIHALYINRNVTNQTQAWGNHNQNQWGINQEHVWAKSCGFDDKSPAAGARGDLMHLWAGNGKVNGSYHSNYYYGYVDQTKSFDDAGNETISGIKTTNLTGNLKGKSKTFPSSSYPVFEPQDSDKGDIARAIFYMAARYNYLSGSDSDGIDAGNPNLEIVNLLNWAPGSSYTSSKTQKGQMGILQDLLEWNRIDPPDSWEIHRNNLLFKNFTNNRNPFIDFPEWAEYIWGKCVDGIYNSTSTGSATLTASAINKFSDTDIVSATGVSLNKETTSITAGSIETLYATVLPNNATNKNVSWSSSNSTIASVSSSGVVTAKKSGSATITVSTEDGNFTDSCVVTVTAARALTSISVSEQTDVFNLNDSFVFDGTITGHYNDSTTETISSGYTISNPDMSVAGEQTVEVTYGGFNTSYKITIINTATESTVEGSVTAVQGVLEGWTKVGADKYADGSVKFSAINHNVFNLDIFTGLPSENMTNLVVTINGKANTSDTKPTPGDKNSYKVEAISGTSNNIQTHDFEQKTGSSVFTTKYQDVQFEMSENLAGTTGIRITFAGKNNGNWGVMSVSWTATYINQILVPTSITASVDRTFYVGETITKDDITVIDNFNRRLSDFNFDEYQFTYDDAVGGDVLSEADFEVSYLTLETILVVNVQRKPFSPYQGTDFEFVASECFSSLTSSYTEDQKLTINGISFVIDGYYYSNGSALSISSSKELRNGSIKNELALKRSIKTIDVTGATPDIQISENGSTWVDYSPSVAQNGNYVYFNIFYKETSASSYVNITKLTFSYKTSETSETLADFVMYEDTENQCVSKFGSAKGFFEGMLSSERVNFMTSEDYVISTARERFLAWAKHEGKSIRAVGGDYIISSNNNISFISESLSTPTTFIIIICVIGVSALGGYLFIRRYKQK